MHNGAGGISNKLWYKLGWLTFQYKCKQRAMYTRCCKIYIFTNYYYYWILWSPSSNRCQNIGSSTTSSTK